METAVKKQTAFRFDAGLLEALKERARREHRSLNNYVESILMGTVCPQPGDETKEAIEEARSGKCAGELNMTSFNSFIDSISAIE